MGETVEVKPMHLVALDKLLLDVQTFTLNAKTDNVSDAILALSLRKRSNAIRQMLYDNKAFPHKLNNSIGKQNDSNKRTRRQRNAAGKNDPFGNT